MANLYRTPLPTKQQLFTKIPKSRTTTRPSIPSPWTSRSLSTLSWGEWWSWSQRWWPGWRHGSGSSYPWSHHTNRQTGHPKTRCVSFSYIEHNCDIPIEFNPSTMTSLDKYSWQIGLTRCTMGSTPRSTSRTLSSLTPIHPLERCS